MGREQRQSQGTNQDDELSLSLGRAKRAHEGVIQVLEQTNTGITHLNNTATDQEVGESTSKTHTTTGDSELARREDSPANAAILKATPHMTRHQISSGSLTSPSRSTVFGKASAGTSQSAEATLVQGLLKGQEGHTKIKRRGQLRY